MKSGTTTVFNVLAQHPEVAPARGKEPGFFAFDGVFAKGVEWYHGLFDFDPNVHRYRLEGSTDYTKYPHVNGVWDRMMALPDSSFKLIYVMRHPMRRIESHAGHTQRTRKEIGQQVSPRPDHSLDAGISDVSLDVSRYAKQIEQFQAAYEAGNLHLMTFEDLYNDPNAALAAVYEFLGLDSADALKALPAFNSAKDKVSVNPLWKRLSKVAPVMRLGKLLMPISVRNGIKKMFIRPDTTKGRFKLTLEEDAALYGQLEDDLRRLQDVYGVDVEGCWGVDLSKRE